LTAANKHGRNLPAAEIVASRMGSVLLDSSGPGIAADVMPHLFNSFITTKARGKDTGLGFRICRRIVVEMHGNMQATNRPQGALVSK
jgi:C4-dicarboxylate-specific signal transduction histidine kinase